MVEKSGEEISGYATLLLTTSRPGHSFALYSVGQIFRQDLEQHEYFFMCSAKSRYDP